MKTIIKLTLAAALAAGTFEAFAQDDPLARLRAQRAQEQQQLGGQPVDTTSSAPDTAPTPVPADSAQAEPPPVMPDQTANFISSAPADWTNSISTNGNT